MENQAEKNNSKTSWQDIQNEIQAGIEPNKPMGDFDKVRRDKYKLVSGITGRPLLVYATAFHTPIKVKIGGPLLNIDMSDKDGFYEIVRNIDSKEIDIFIHSPGGSAEATESIVKILRSKFDYIRFIITGAAKSAATILVMSGNEILMDKSAELGPIDPQIRVKERFCPAGAIKRQFTQAREELKKTPSNLPVWIPILKEYAPSLLIECTNFIDLSKKLVMNWLKDYMFKEGKDALDKSKRIATFLSDEENFLSHARRVDVEDLEKLDVKVKRLENESGELQDAIRQLHFAVMATLESTNAVKIFENSEGAVLLRMVNVRMAPPGVSPRR